MKTNEKILFLAAVIVVIGCSDSQRKNDKLSIESSDTVFVEPELIDSITSDTIPTREIKNVDLLLYSSAYVDSIILNLDSCYQMAQHLSDENKEIGVLYYRTASRHFSKLQSIAFNNNEIFPKRKQRVLIDILDFYNRIFKGRDGYYEFADQLKYINESTKGWPKEKSPMEQDLEDNVIRIFIGKGLLVDITLPDNGTWCIYGMKRTENILVEGEFPAKGYGKFKITKAQLPVYFGETKNMTITNTNWENSIEVVFQECSLTK